MTFLNKEQNAPNGFLRARNEQVFHFHNHEGIWGSEFVGQLDVLTDLWNPIHTIVLNDQSPFRAVFLNGQLDQTIIDLQGRHSHARNLHSQPPCFSYDCFHLFLPAFKSALPDVQRLVARAPGETAPKASAVSHTPLEGSRDSFGN
jgi:hypothetical protein